MSSTALLTVLRQSRGMVPWASTVQTKLLSNRISAEKRKAGEICK